MKKINLYSAVLLSMMLSACSVHAESTVKSSTKTKETVWQYDGGDTVIPSKKEEMVSVQADAAGNPSKLTVDTKLSGISGNGAVEDMSDLKDISNAQGDEQFSEMDGKLYWQNLGNDISYTGTSSSSLPIDVKMTYFLDDTVIDPNDLAGKNGHVKIRFDYTNHVSYETVHVPFVCMSVLMMDEDSFSNIRVKNGKVMSSDGTSTIVGFAMPSLREDLNISSYEDIDIDIPQYVEVEADTTDFSLDFTETIVSNGVFSEIEDEDLNDLREMSDAFKDLGEAGNTLVDGGKKLSSAFDEIKQGTEGYLDGVDALSSGLSELKEVSSTINENTSALVEGSKALSDMLNAIDVNALDTTAMSVMTSVKNDVVMIANVSKMMETLSTSFTSLSSTMQSVFDESQIDEEKKQEITKQLEDCSTTLVEMQEQLSSSFTDLENQISVFGGVDLEALKSQLLFLQETTKALSQGTTALSNGINGLDGGLTQLSDAFTQAIQNNQTLKNAYSQYASGLKEFEDGIAKLNTEGLQRLYEKGGKEGSRLLDTIALLKKADASYQTFTSLLEQQEGSVSFMIETGKISEKGNN